jgi:hypothetical protein
LNVYDSLTLDTRVTTNATNIASMTSDLSTVQTTLSGVESTLDTKQDVIDTTHKLSSTLVSTNVSASASTLEVILQSLTDINTTQSTTLTDLNSTVISLQSQIDMNDGELLALQNADVAHDSQIATIQGDVSINPSNRSCHQTGHYQQWQQTQRVGCARLGSKPNTRVGE